MHKSNESPYLDLAHTKAAAIILTILALPAICAGATINFDDQVDNTEVTTQYANLTFSNVVVLAEGISLNEFEFPPISGSNVASDNGGPVSIVFGMAVNSFAAYFTHSLFLTVRGYDFFDHQIVTSMSLFSDNLALSGDFGSQPNELLQLTSPVGISKITITGDPAGGSFTFDNMTYSSSGTGTPEPGGLGCIVLGTVALLALRVRQCLAYVWELTSTSLMVQMLRHPAASTFRDVHRCQFFSILDLFRRARLTL